jgi:hypothetical protein
VSPAVGTGTAAPVCLANYYCKFVLRFSALAAPLTALCQCSPRATFRWGPAEQTSFDTLKAALVSAPVLRVWDPARPTLLLTEASELAVSAILEQPNDTGEYHPVAFEWSKLTPPERLYLQHLLELLAVVHALKTLRPYLLDKPFTLHTDNAASCGSRTSCTSATTRRVGSTYSPSTSTQLCTSPAGPTQLTSSRASGSATARGQPSPRATTIQALRSSSTPLPRPSPKQAQAPTPPASCTRSSLQPSAPPCLPIPSWAPSSQQPRPTPPTLSLLPARVRPAAGPRAHLFIARDGLLYHQSPRGDRLCIPSVGELRVQVLRELHATPLGGHF